MIPFAHNIEIVSCNYPASSEIINFQRQSELGQFMTPMKIAHFMAALFEDSHFSEIRLLDPGAGFGSLSIAFAKAYFLKQKGNVEISAYEIDSNFSKALISNFEKFRVSDFCNYNLFSYSILEGDFIKNAVELILSNVPGKFTHAILNPPYKKIHSQSEHRHLLRSIGIETVNLYTAFLALTIHLLADGGEVVAIVPRSFCNGVYYKSFRKWMLSTVSIKQIHLFKSRDQAFKEQDVLQENIIIYLVKNRLQEDVVLSFSNDDSFSDYRSYKCPFKNVLKEKDEESFIRIPNGTDQYSIEDSSSIKYSLAEIGIEVSTGPVVDFRLKEFLLEQPEPDSVPLVYPCHFENNRMLWPRINKKKPNAIRLTSETEKWLWPNEFYVVVRRVSSKEENRRVIANVINPDFSNCSLVGFENHLNVFHICKSGLDENLAYGLALFLNSTVIDKHFRSFSGHTQVNATDLRAFKYPSRKVLISLGKWTRKKNALTQANIDKKIKELN